MKSDSVSKLQKKALNRPKLNFASLMPKDGIQKEGDINLILETKNNAFEEKNEEFFQKSILFPKEFLEKFQVKELLGKVKFDFISVFFEKLYQGCSSRGIQII